MFVVENEDSKKTYLNVCKWVAKNIVSKVEIGETFWKIEKVSKSNLPAFRLELYAVLSEKEIQEKFCDKCRSFHSSFYINAQVNCSVCQMQNYIGGIAQKLEIKKNYRKEKLKFLLNKA